MKNTIVVILLLLLIVSFSYRIDLARSSHDVISELMYFPSGTALRAVSMGFYGTLADLVWLRFIQYYGEHRLTDQRFEFLYHILDILTTLDNRFIYAYTLGGLMLTHDAKRPDQARKLLKKGMYANPDDWRMPFMYGFMHYLFLKEYSVAKAYFKIASQKPNAPDMTKRWAAFVTYFKLGDKKTALKMWIDFYNSTENPEEKILAESYIKRIKMELDIEFLDQAIELFKAKFDRRMYSLKQLVSVGLIDSIPQEPHGGKYFLRDGRVYSTFRAN